MPFYKTRTVVRDCEQWKGTEESLTTLIAWAGQFFSFDGKVASVYVAANKEWLDIEVGEWIIKDSHGFYPCKDDVFHEKYERL